jgi:tetratricopeptide (TPR) repeat protein/DNA-binding XRE family transcriptional regulator
MPGTLGARRGKGIAVRPEAVRQARLESGLSLAELAGGDVTRATIHQVETGKIRPSMRTLELIARRTGRPVSWFMLGQDGSDEQQAGRDELARLVDTGEYAKAVELGTRMLDVELQPGIEADIRFSIGRALLRMSNSAEALPHVTRARQLFDQLGDAWMVAHALEQEGGAQFLLEDPRSLSTALEALDRADRLEPPAPALRASILNLIANIHMRSHDWRNAARFFEMGLGACEDLFSVRVAARLSDGLSMARQRLGDFAGALNAGERAYALYARDSDVRGLIRAENNLGYVLLQQSNLEAAAAHLNRALQLCEDHDVQRCRSPILNSIAELHLARHEPRLACKYLRRALDAAKRLGERDSEATTRHLLGTAYLQLGDEDAAHEYFTAAIELLEELHLSERLRVCAKEYAEMLQARGRLEESIAYWRIAATASELSMMRSPVEPAGLTREAGA